MKRQNVVSTEVSGNMKIAKDSVVGLEYTLHLGDGETVDESGPDEPLEYLHGHDQIVPGLETALAGKEVGFTSKVVVTPQDGYGDHDPEGVQEVDRSAFPPGADITVGNTLAAESEDGEDVPFVVKEVKGDKIVIDLNHPLAGKTLHFDVTVKTVRAATAEELEHGHAHGEGEHHDHE